eukprot:6213762-Pleurochrysis_carterae.AAC.1
MPTQYVARARARRRRAHTLSLRGARPNLRRAHATAMAKGRGGCVVGRPRAGKGDGRCVARARQGCRRVHMRVRKRRPRRDDRAPPGRVSCALSLALSRGGARSHYEAYGRTAGTEHVSCHQGAGLTGGPRHTRAALRNKGSTHKYIPRGYTLEKCEQITISSSVREASARPGKG